MVTSSPISAVSPITVKPWSMKKLLADLGAGMDVDRGQEAREMVDQPREEIKLAAVQPVRRCGACRAPSTPG